MANALMKLKARLARIETELCKFTVEKIFKGYPSTSTAQVFDPNYISLITS